jgi:hypothetical protein
MTNCLYNAYNSLYSNLRSKPRVFVLFIQMLSCDSQKSTKTISGKKVALRLISQLDYQIDLYNKSAYPDDAYKMANMCGGKWRKMTEEEKYTLRKTLFEKGCLLVVQERRESIGHVNIVSSSNLYYVVKKDNLPKWCKIPTEFILKESFEKIGEYEWKESLGIEFKCRIIA